MNNLLIFSRQSNIFNNIISDTCRKRSAKSFVKKLGVYNYKKKPVSYYSNPHSLDLKRTELFKGTPAGYRKMQVLRGLSSKPFGKFTSKGRFIMDYNRIPRFIVPKIEDSEVNTYNLTNYIKVKTIC